MNLSALIQQRLRVLGMSQKELSMHMGVSPQYINQIIMGKSRPSNGQLAVMEQILGVGPKAFGSSGWVVDESIGRRASILDRMPGIEVAYLKCCMDSLNEARRVLLSQTPANAMRDAFIGKKDTKLFDAACESAIVNGLKAFNERCTIFTEESTAVDGRRDFANQASYFIDPFDRSSAFVQLLTCARDKGASTVGEAFTADYNTLANLNAPFGSISCVRDGQIAFNVMLDYASGEVYVACKAMLKHGNIAICSDPEKLALYGDDIRFESRRGRVFTCFLGRSDDSEKRQQYEKQLKDLDFQPGEAPPQHLQDPGGPARILFLADRCPADSKVACILSNGEKIGEWCGWLAYVAYSDDLMAYDVCGKHLTQRDSILLAPPPDYSIFQIDSDGICRIDLERILYLSKPVFYRGVLLVAHSRSSEIISEMRVMKSRELKFRSESV